MSAPLKSAHGGAKSDDASAGAAETEMSHRISTTLVKATGADAAAAATTGVIAASSLSLPPGGDSGSGSSNPITAGPTMSAMMEVPGGAADGIQIRVWFLDDGVTRAAPHPVPDVATLKQMLPEQDPYLAMSPVPTVVGDHFAAMPMPASARAPDAASSPRGQTKATHDGPAGARRSSCYPTIQLAPPDTAVFASSPTSASAADAHPAWVSVRSASTEQLSEILDSLPVHVLTRRRILSLLSVDPDEVISAALAGSAPGGDGAKGAGEDEDASSASGSEASSASNSDDEHGGTDSANGDRRSRGSKATRPRPRRRYRPNARDNYVEYFPAHGYAVMCLQAVALHKGESTRRGAIQHDGTMPRGTHLPCTPVVALAFESTLFTFSVGRFGGEGDVRLIIANQARPAGSASPRDTGSPANHAPVRSVRGAGSPSAGRPPGWVAVFGSTQSLDAAAGVPASGNRDGHMAGSAGREEPLAYLATADDFTSVGARERGEVAAGGEAAYYGSPSAASSPGYRAATAMSVVCSSLVSAIIAYLQQSTRALLIEADQLDELVLQILPSRVDQDDLLVRTKNLRHLIAFFHMDALQKERVLKELLLPAMRQTPLAQSTQAVERYQRSLSSVRSTVLKLRKGRDIVNMASMTLISGVSARLLSHCNFMDYLNQVQTQIAVVVMPITIIPGLWSMNVSVPYGTSTSMTPFYILFSVTIGLLLIGVAQPMYRFFMYKAPRALAPLE